MAEDLTKHDDSVRRIAAWYSSLAVVLLNTVLAIVVVGFLAWALLPGTEAPTNGNEPRSWLIEKYGFDVLKRAYPSWDERELRGFLHETSHWESEYEPFTQFRQKPRRSKHINISENGYRPVPGQGPWPPGRSAAAVFFFGGSTTMGAGLPDNETIPARFQELARTCRNRVHVYNFGRGYYFSTQERILFEQLLLGGHAPALAVFLDGLNDFYFAGGEPQWTPELRSFMNVRERTHASGERAGFWSHILAALKTTALARHISEAGRSDPRAIGKDLPGGRNFKPPLEAPEDEAKLDGVARAVIERWTRNRKLIERSATAFGTRTLFAFQPIPTYAYNVRALNVFRENADLFGEHRRSATGYRAMADKVRAEDMGSNFLWLADIQVGRDENLYVDAVHYTASFSRELADRLFGFAVRNQLLKCT